MNLKLKPEFDIQDMAEICVLLSLDEETSLFYYAMLNHVQIIRSSV